MGDHYITTQSIENVIVNSIDSEEYEQLQNVKLPTLQLPKSSGLYLKWLEFEDTFESLVHNNRSINNIHKIFSIQLKYCVEHFIGTLQH